MVSKRRVPTEIKPWSIIFMLLMIFGIYYLIPKFFELNNIMSELKHIDWWWFGIGIVLMVVIYLILTQIQYIAGDRRGNRKELLVLTLRGSFLNHFLPFSIGIITLITRYYTHFVPKTQAALIATIPTIASVIVSVVLLVFISPVTLSHITSRIGDDAGDWLVPVSLVMVIICFILALLYWRVVRQFMNHIAADLSDRNSVKRLGLVLLYTILLTAAYSAVLWVSALATHNPITYVESVALYVIVWAIGSIVPTPGGIGATEATLTIGIASLGINLSTAAAIMIVFRFISFWLLLIPGLAAMTDRRQFHYHRIK